MLYLEWQCLDWWQIHLNLKINKVLLKTSLQNRIHTARCHHCIWTRNNEIITSLRAMPLKRDIKFVCDLIFFKLIKYCVYIVSTFSPVSVFEQYSAWPCCSFLNSNKTFFNATSGDVTVLHYLRRTISGRNSICYVLSYGIMPLNLLQNSYHRMVYSKLSSIAFVHKNV